MTAKIPFHKADVGPLRVPKPGSSRQHAHGGGSFSSEAQRRYMWAVHPRAAKKWADDRKTNKTDWADSPKGVAKSYKRAAPGALARRAK